jgi:hypothetical protein
MRSRGFWQQARDSVARAPAPTLVLLILAGSLCVVMVRIVFTDTAIPTVSSDVEAAARSNERMLQMVQWSLATVLGLGLALIGINGFTTTRDRVEIAELESRMQDTITRYEAQTASVNDRIAALDEALWPHERQLLWDEYYKMRQNQQGQMLSTPSMVARMFRELDTDPKRKRAAAEFMVHGLMDHHPNTVEAHDALVEVLPALEEYDPALANRAYHYVTRDLELAPTVPESERPRYRSTLPLPPKPL